MELTAASVLDFILVVSGVSLDLTGKQITNARHQPSGHSAESSS